MFSITDYVKEGLKYPFNNVKKVIIYGILCLLISLTYVGSVWSFRDGIIEFSRKNAEIMSAMAANNSGQVMNNVTHFSSFPTQNLVIMVILGIIAIIIALFISGYNYKIIDFAINKKNNLPEFDNIKEMFINGLKIAIVSIIYAIIPGILSFVGFILFADTEFGGSTELGFVLMIIACIVGIILSLIQIIAIDHMIAKNSFKAAFNFSEILDIISSISWLRLFAVLVIVNLVVLILIAGIGILFMGIGTFAAILNEWFGLFVSMVLLVVFTMCLVPFIGIFSNRVFGAVYNERELN